LGNYLGYEPIHYKILSRSGVRGRGSVRCGRELSATRFTSDNFLGKVVDHGLGAFFSHQTH
jgi:hypothetical protein